MSNKLDPQLQAMLDATPHEAGQEVVLLLGLTHAADDGMLAELRASGLQVRSVIGDVLTGAAPLGRIQAIAEHPAIVKIEASRPLQPEAPAPLMPE